MHSHTQCPRFHSATPFLRCLVLVLAALGSSGCPGLPKAVPTSNDSAVPDGGALPTDACVRDDCKVSWPSAAGATGCPTGGCDPRTVNGRGIYIGTGSDYCLEDFQSRSRFCPEAFVHMPAGADTPPAVELHARDAQELSRIYRSPLRATRVAASGAEEPLTLLGIRDEQTRLVITYKTADGRTHSATDEELRALRFGFQYTAVMIPDPVWSPHDFVMRVEPMGTHMGVHRYRLFFKLDLSKFQPDPSRPEWTSHCMLGGAARDASFLGGRRVDGLTAEVHPARDTTTVSCDTGAIDTCLTWGYTPWNPRTRNPDASEYLFQSCLQAKRAAYFVGRGDHTSYTVEGTPIARRDPYGINPERIDRLEALWSPRGAECLNLTPEDNRRHPELRLANPALLRQVPQCTPEWSTFGRLATGKRQSAP